MNVEFVSANPTGPLHIGNARGAFVGDLLCRVLEAGGQQVTREYYFNDVGGQIPNLGASIAAIRRGEAVPEDGYHGDYVRELAAAVPDDVWAEATAPEPTPAAILGHWAAVRVREGIERSLAALGVRFDVWTTEASLHEGGWVERAVERLRQGGHVYEQDGAIWFRSTDFGDDKDRVIIRSNGEPTYFAADIGYVTEKFSRGFDHLIYVWGADHHGTVARVRNAAKAMGYDPDAVQMLLYSWVRFVRDGVEVSMSKRAGDFITLDELLGEIGVDSARWFFASRSVNTGIDFDIELAKKQSNENPVYYVQYAHARIASIVRKAAEAGLDAGGGRRRLAGGAARRPPWPAPCRRFPEVIEDAVAAEETHGITAYATELATTFHAFYRDARVVDPEAPERSAARLALAGRGADHAGQRPRAARDLRARSRCRAGRPVRPRRRSPPRSTSRSSRVSSSDAIRIVTVCRPAVERSGPGWRGRRRPSAPRRRTRRRPSRCPTRCRRPRPRRRPARR